ncbi:hypothetical protein ACFQL8_09970 [Streptomyces goshikiensis]|nr:hypothetical protein [Streptomyces goshikiensis]
MVEQTFTLIHQFERLAVSWERRRDLHNGLVAFSCSLLCPHHLKKASS